MYNIWYIVYKKSGSRVIEQGDWCMDGLMDLSTLGPFNAIGTEGAICASGAINALGATSAFNSCGA